ncbi:MAG: hypothetical protein BJ554DRAFT_7437 [Olpidium bornovanus]|uniref:Uncharacterized protein n=1 Tax=Olpidium bornovanus TaxID=278681 RepID=A0A8H8DM65_9FUNG|nr:MAG: hypothetical protein BJ554DRAFT_7437 [Olpidium bornovanus]
MVLHEGRVAEFAPPLDLLSNPKGLFRSLVEQSGDDALEKLRALAHAAEPSPGCDCSSEGGTTATATGVSSAAAQPMAGGAAGLVEPSASPSTANFSRRAGVPAGPVSPMPMSLLGMFIDPGEATPTAEAGRRPVSSDPDLHVAAAASNGISCDRAVDNPPVRSSHAENNG